MKVLRRARARCDHGLKPFCPVPGKLKWLLLVAAVLPGLSISAQQASRQPFSVRVETQLVQVHVHVLGRDGKPVTGLKKSDFDVKENGRRRHVTTLRPFLPRSTQAKPMARLHA